MENNDSKAKSSDEIDLAQFFRWMGRGFNRVGNGLLLSLATLRNLFFVNRLFFAGVILIGLALGAIYSELLKKKFYKATMVLSCDYLNTQILQNTIEKLNLLSSEPAREGLAEVLKIDIETAKNIQKFEFKSFVSEDDVVEMEVLRTQLNNVAADKKDIIEKVITKLTIENKNAYEIRVLVYNPDVVKPLETALVNYFNSSEYVKRRIEIKKENLLNRKAKLERESRRLDSLKAVLLLNYQMFAKTSRGSNNVWVGENGISNNPLDIFKEDLALNKEILDIDKQLYLQPDFEVVEGFTTFKEPESASLLKILFTSFWISFVLGYLIIGAWRFDRMLSKYPTQA
jgi:hypothetical protein